MPRRGVTLRRALKPALAVAAAGLAWGHFEAGWVRLQELRVPLRGLLGDLDGLRIAHLSDFHLGLASRGEKAVERAVEWVAHRRPDLTLISGDLVSNPRGERKLRELLDWLPACYAVLGNHDVAKTRDPFGRRSRSYDFGAATLLANDSRTIELRGRRVQIAGVDPMSYMAGLARPDELSDPSADLRILLCHFPRVIDRIRSGSFDLVLAGHLHAGQICVPFPGGRLRLAHLRWHYIQGLYERPAGVLHLSPGLGTTFVPFRFFARPEATELILKSVS